MDMPLASPTIERRGLASLAALVLVSMLYAMSALGQSTVMEVIPLKYRTSEQIIPVLKPMLDKNGSMSGMQNQLIIRTTPSNLADLKKMLASLDTMPRRLMITVTQDAGIERDRSSAEVSGRLGTGDATVTIPGGQSGTQAEVRRGTDIVRGRVDSTRSVDSDRNTQTLQVLEGNSAFIRVGQSIPVPQREVVREIVNGRIVERRASSVDYRDVNTGFYVLPRVSGDQVTLEIRPQRDTLARPEQNLPRGSINTQSAATVVSGPLGQWIEIGGIAQGIASERSTLLGSTREVAADNRRILLKVEEIR